MSLSFVSSAVLSSTDGVSHNEEKTIESKEVQSLRTHNAQHNKPLFDQLRSNKEAEQAKYDENTKAMMGMRTLDEEECAHLDAVEKQRREQQDLVKAGVEEELARFRAARADRRLVESSVEFDEEEEEGQQSDGGKDDAVSNVLEKQPQQKQVVSSLRPKIIPKIIGKKKRKKSASTTSSVEERGNHTKKQAVTSAAAASSTTSKAENKNPTENKKENDKNDSDSDQGGLGGLLGCYGSDDDDDSDEEN